MRRNVLVLAILSTVAGPGLANALEITVNPEVTISEAGAQAVVSGTVQCPNGNTAYQSAELVQVEKGGKVIASGYGYTNFGCTGLVQPWKLTMNASIPFKPGAGTVRAYVQYCDDTGCPYDETSEAVKLSRAK